MNELYKSKLVTAKEAAKVVKSGNWVDYGWTVTTPVDFDKELAKRLPELHNELSWRYPDVGTGDFQN